jgi:hypothetical protein
MKVKITNTSQGRGEIGCWYNIDNIIEVKPYRHNSEMYYEVDGWDGDLFGGNMPNRFWICKCHCERLPDFEIKLDNLLFEMEL